jgi:broad specificity phosphatase PhoE
MQPCLILVRHAAVRVDPAVNSHQWLLTPGGRIATHQLAHMLKPFRPRHIFTSEEPKAITTGAALAEVLALPSQAWPGLQEHDRQGELYFNNKADFETAVSRLFAYPDELVFGNETAVQACRRFSTAVSTLCQTHLRETLILSSHGTVLTLFICQHNPELDPLQFWLALTMPCAFVLSLPEKRLVQTILI